MSELGGLDLLHAYRQMVLIREFEDAVQRLFLQGVVPGTTHLCQGQEAVAVGFAGAMRAGDVSTYTYRGHGHALARGMAPEAALAEIMGRATGCNHGKGGSMHLTDAGRGLFGSFAIVGAGLPVAVGLGRAAQLGRTGAVSVTFFGDGATNIGAFHEALNLAAVWEAPVVFVCENNLYGEYTRYDATARLTDLADRAGSYGMPGMVVDGNDVVVVHGAAREALDRARGGGGPSLVECKTYRHHGHSRSDPARYRSRDEVDSWLERDPLRLAREALAGAGLAGDDELERIRQEVAGRVQAAAEAALTAAWPEPEEVVTHVYD